MTKTELKQLKAATENLTRWESSGKSFGHFNVLEKAATNKKGADKIYEFFCLMRVLDDLRLHYKIDLVPGTRTDKIFPQAPSPKIGWPYFMIENKTDATNKYQVCYGTKIKLSLSPLTTVAADISIQKENSTYDPDESMVDLIMDAKFKFDDTKALSIEQIHAFIQRVNILQTRGADVMPLTFNQLTSIKTNCLLTNGATVDHHQQYCANSKIKQVGKFDSRGSVFNIVG